MLQLARLGFVLIGLDFGFSACMSIVHVIRFTTFDSPESAWISLFAIALAVLLGIVPAIFLVRRNREFTAYVFPDLPAEQAEPIDTNSATAAGIAVFGAYFVITGLFGVFGATAWLVPIRSFEEQIFRTGVAALFEALAQIGVGVACVRFAHPLARLLRGSTPAA